MTRTFRLTPEAAAHPANADLQHLTGTEEIEPTHTPGVVKVRWNTDLATWNKITDLEQAQ